MVNLGDKTMDNLSDLHCILFIWLEKENFSILPYCSLKLDNLSRVPARIASAFFVVFAGNESTQETAAEKSASTAPAE